MISIIIPSYNSVTYITCAIESIVKQTCTDREIIVIDGSTDNTRDVLKPYIDQGIVKYLFQKPCGVSAARNFGIQHASGDLIAFQDADDIWYKGKLSLQLEAFEKHRNAALMFTNHEEIDENGVSLEIFQGKPLSEWWEAHKIPGSDIAYGQIYKELLVGGGCMHTSSIVVKKAAIMEAGGFDERFKTCEDYDLWLRITKKYPVLFINKVLCGYRVHGEGLSGDKVMRKFRWGSDYIRVYEKHLQEKLIPSEYQKLMKKVLAERCWNLGWSYFQRGSFEEARSYFLKALSYNVFYLKLWIYWASTFLPLSTINRIRYMNRFMRHILKFHSF